MNISDRSRRDSVSALAQQYQRFSTAVPIARDMPSLQPSANAPDFCPGALALQRGNTLIHHRWRCPPCGVAMMAWESHKKTPLGEPSSPTSWATGCKGMMWVFSFAQHVAIPRGFRHGQDAVYRQCIICWEKLGIVSKKMTKEDWLTHVNEHLTSGGFQLCRDTSGRQIRRAACTIRSCQKIHTRG
jgi:hypothetical protein